MCSINLVLLKRELTVDVVVFLDFAFVVAALEILAFLEAAPLTWKLDLLSLNVALFCRLIVSSSVFFGSFGVSESLINSVLFNYLFL